MFFLWEIAYTPCSSLHEGVPLWGVLVLGPVDVDADLETKFIHEHTPIRQIYQLP